MNKKLGAESAPNFDKLFENLNTSKKTVDEKLQTNFLNVVNDIFTRLENFSVLFFAEYFNEEDAARYLRLPDPRGKGKQTIRNYALRSRKLTFAKIGRESLLFHKDDLKKLYQALKSESFRDY